MIPENLKKVIEEAKQELKNNLDGELILPIRKKSGLRWESIVPKKGKNEEHN